MLSTVSLVWVSSPLFPPSFLGVGGWVVVCFEIESIKGLKVFLTLVLWRYADEPFFQLENPC